MKSTFFIVVSTLVIIASIGRPENPAVGNPTIKPEALNCTIGDSTVIACYPFSGIDFVMQVHRGRTFVTTDAGQTVFEAEIYIANVGEWEAVNQTTGEFIRLNTGTGVTEAFLNGELSIYLPEKP